MNEEKNPWYVALLILAVIFAVIAAIFAASGCANVNAGLVPVSKTDIEDVRTALKAAIEASNKASTGKIEELNGVLNQLSMTLTKIDNSITKWEINNKTTYGINPLHIIIGYIIWELLKYGILPIIRKRFGIKKE